MVRDKEADLDDALENSFPASDPPAATNPSRFTGPEVSYEGHTGTALDARIRQRAYELWLAEGQPEGCAERHWKIASEIVAAEG